MLGAKDGNEVRLSVDGVVEDQIARPHRSRRRELLDSLGAAIDTVRRYCLVFEIRKMLSVSVRA